AEVDLALLAEERIVAEARPAFGVDRVVVPGVGRRGGVAEPQLDAHVAGADRARLAAVADHLEAAVPLDRQEQRELDVVADRAAHVAVRRRGVAASRYFRYFRNRSQHNLRRGEARRQVDARDRIG